MTDLINSAPKFDRPPVIETRIAVQFEPLSNLQVGHFGLFWQECLGTTAWQILQDQPAVPRESEQFGAKRLRPNKTRIDMSVPPVCMRLARGKERTVQLQPDRLTYSWNRENRERPSYEVVKREFDELYGAFEVFTRKWLLRPPVPNLWQLTYVNAIPQEALWKVPSDWRRVLSGIFPDEGFDTGPYEWATFDGTWYFVIPDERGRVRVKIQKAVREGSDDVVLLLILRAQGELDRDRSGDWASELDVGHGAIVELFNRLGSDEAKTHWGLKK